MGTAEAESLMEVSAFFKAMFATHLPYVVIALAIIIVARRTRRAVERLVTKLEEHVRGGP